jgi:acetolactate synthase-1/2/3 large subunit
VNGAEAVAQTLRAAGVETVFGLPGAHNLALWPACEAAGVRIVGMRTEQGCAHAADGYARATGKVGVALVTTGPGAANTVGAVGEAWASRSPVVVIATDIPASLRRPGVYRGVLHETTDQAALFAPITKLQTRSVAEALRAAISAPSRPVYVGIPSDALTAPADPEVLEPPDDGSCDGVMAIDDAIVRAQRPLLWVGGGARDAERAIDMLARKLGAPVVTTYQARGILAPDHPLLVPAPPHEPEVTALIASADVAIIVGSDLDQMNTMQWRLPLPRERIAINVDPADASKNLDVVTTARLDARSLGAFSLGLEERDPWAGDLQALSRKIRARIAADPKTSDAIAFLEQTEAALPSDAVVFADMCVAGYWLAGHMRVEMSRGLHYPMGWGTLGFAPAAAIGAAVAERPTVAFVGDGGMLFGLGELSALAEHRTPCTIVVVDDGGYGMLRHSPVTTAANELPAVGFVNIARAFGIEAHDVDGLADDYAKALAAAVESGEPRVLHVRARLHPPVTTTPFWPLKEESE